MADPRGSTGRQPEANWAAAGRAVPNRPDNRMPGSESADRAPAGTREGGAAPGRAHNDRHLRFPPRRAHPIHPRLRRAALLSPCSLFFCYCTPCPLGLVHLLFHWSVLTSPLSLLVYLNPSAGVNFRGGRLALASDFV